VRWAKWLEAKKLEKILPQTPVVSNNAWLFKELTAAQNMPQGFFLVTG
jgi:hypothetical protein